MTFTVQFFRTSNGGGLGTNELKALQQILSFITQSKKLSSNAPNFDKRSFMCFKFRTIVNCASPFLPYTHGYKAQRSWLFKPCTEKPLQNGDKLTLKANKL